MPKVVTSPQLVMPLSRSEGHRQSRPLPSILREFWLALIPLTALAYFATFFFVHVLHRNEFPFSDTLLPPRYRGLDFLCFSDRFEHFRTAQFFGDYPQAFNYPAPIALIYGFFYKCCAYPDETYLAVAAFAYLVAAVLFVRALLRRGITRLTAIAFTASTLLLSYPLLLAFYLAQMEIVVWAIASLGLFAYLRGRGYTAAACFGVAASLKYYPIIYLGLALARRQYRQAALGLAVCAGSLLLSLRILGPSTLSAWHGLSREMVPFKVYYLHSFHPLENGIDHSLFGLIKNTLYHLRHLELVHVVVNPYLALVAIAGLALYFLRIVKLPLINQVLALTVAAVLLPPISHDYTLIHLYAPWTMLTLYLIDRNSRTPAPRPIVWIYICFALLFVPENYLFYNAIRMGGQAKAVLLVALFYLALRYPVESEDFEPPAESLQVPDSPLPLARAS